MNNPTATPEEFVQKENALFLEGMERARWPRGRDPSEGEPYPLKKKPGQAVPPLASGGREESFLPLGSWPTKKKAM